MGSELSVVVTTCLKFSDLWENQIICLDKYWIEHPNVFYVTDDCDDTSISSVEFIKSTNDYSFRLLNALEQIDSDYIFLTLDDYLLCKKVNSKSIHKFIELMKKLNIDYLRLFDQEKTREWLDKKNKIHLLPLKHKCYEVNLYPGIWKKDSLIKIIKQDENPWKFEVRLDRRCRDNGYLCAWVSNKGIYDFVDTVRKGKYLPKAYRFLKKEKLYISNREIKPLSETIKLDIVTFFRQFIPERMRERIRKKRNKTFFSDYADTND